MATQKFMGRHSLVKRLTEQVGSHELAVQILRKRGQMHPDSEELTAGGMVRDVMTAAERAKDRAAKAEQRSPEDFRYDPRANRAHLRSKK